MKIHQIYFDEQQKAVLDPDFIPYDNSNSDNPTLAEWWVIYKEFQNQSKTEPWGFLSWRFYEKMRLTGNQVKRHITNNPGYDVYIFNPCVPHEALFYNSWIQGDMHHEGLIEVTNYFLEKIEFPIDDVIETMTDRTNTVFCSNIIATNKFWKPYIEFTSKIFDLAKNDSWFFNKMFAPQRETDSAKLRHPRHLDLPLFPFVQERLISLFLLQADLKVNAFQYDDVTVPTYWKNNLGALQYLSDKKTELTRPEWAKLREQMVRTNPRLTLGI